MSRFFAFRKLLPRTRVFLVEILFKAKSYNCRCNKSSLFVLNDVHTKCKECSWYNIEGKVVGTNIWFKLYVVDIHYFSKSS